MRVYVVVEVTLPADVSLTNKGFDFVVVSFDESCPDWQSKLTEKLFQQFGSHVYIHRLYPMTVKSRRELSAGLHYKFDL